MIAICPELAQRTTRIAPEYYLHFPPYGTPEYMELQRIYEKQSASTDLLRFAIARIKKYGTVI